MRGSPADMGEQPKEEGCTGGGRMALPGSTYGPSPGAAIGAAPVATSGTYSGTYSGATSGATSGTHSGTYSGTYSGATSGATSGTTSDAGDEPTTAAAAAAPSDPASASADIFVRGAGPVCMGSGLWRELVRWQKAKAQSLPPGPVIFLCPIIVTSILSDQSLRLPPRCASSGGLTPAIAPTPPLSQVASQTTLPGVTSPVRREGEFSLIR